MIAVHKQRGTQILWLLKEHRLLSHSTINSLLSPCQKPKLTSRSLAILLRKGLLIRSKIARHKFFYRLSQTPTAVAEISKTLDCQPDELVLNAPRVANPIHHELVELWIGNLMKTHPSAQIFREPDILRSAEARSVIGWRHTDETLALPDFLAKLPASSPRKFAWIGFEIELHRKSRSRITSKLLKYAASSTLNGLVYISDIDVVIRQVDDVFRMIQGKSDQRIGHFAENFLLFSSADINGQFSPSRMVRLSGDAVSLSDWVDVICSKNLRELRNQDFEKVGGRVHLKNEETVPAEFKESQGFQ